MDRRRLICSSLALVGSGETALAQPAPLLFQTGPLATNALAKRFRAFPSSIVVPSTKQRPSTVLGALLICEARPAS